MPLVTNRHAAGRTGRIRALMTLAMVPVLALGLVVVPAFWSFGAVIEYVRARTAHSDMQSALDGLLIEAVSTRGDSESTASVQLRAGRDKRQDGVVVRVNPDGSVTAAMTGSHDTVFWRMLGYPKFVYPVMATAYRTASGEREIIRIRRAASTLSIAYANELQPVCTNDCADADARADQATWTRTSYLAQFAGY